MKKLVIVSHPDIENSVINKRWIEELQKYPDQFTVHHLEAVYPDGIMDVASEQVLIEEHDMLILQFPLYWYSSPPMLKKWQDEVLTYGWAYGSKGKAMKDRDVALAISFGVPKDDYKPNGVIGATEDEVLTPLRTTMRYIGANYRGHFSFYEANNEPSAEIVDQGAKDYVRFAMDL